MTLEEKIDALPDDLICISASKVKDLEAKLAIAMEALKQIAPPDLPQHMINNDDACDQINIAREALEKI